MGFGSICRKVQYWEQSGKRILAQEPVLPSTECLLLPLPSSSGALQQLEDLSTLSQPSDQELQ